MAKTEGHPAIVALESEIAAVEKAQAPTRAQIAELEGQLTEGQQIIARNRAAIDVLSGNVTIASAAPRTRARRSSGTGLTASQIDERAVVDFIGANQPIGASPIGQHVGASGNALSLKLRAMVESGVLTKQGERRATKYSLKVG
jgi:uncharacterized coiled-coil protein SlyX